MLDIELIANTEKTKIILYIAVFSFHIWPNLKPFYVLILFTYFDKVIFNRADPFENILVSND